MLVTISIFASKVARSQEAEIAGPTGTSLASSVGTDVSAGSVVNGPTVTSDRPPVEQEIAVMGMIPAGDYRMFSATVRCNAWTVGVEYDRHSFGYFLGSRFDYVAEVLPFVLLSQPAKSDFWGNAISPNQELVPGLAIYPFGIRFLWRGDKRVKPYVISKVGAVGFTQKAMSQKASYANITVQAAFGLKMRMTDRLELRLEPFQFFHVSNFYLAASNPGMDELAVRIGVSYRLGKRGGE
jgi:hypothetical protein